MKLSSKITIAAISTACIALLVGILIQKHNLMKFGITEAHQRMGTIVKQAETVRTRMADLHKNSAFDYDKLHKELSNTRDIKETSLFKSVPIVSALASAKETAEKGGFKFRVATRNPRNPENTPDDYESSILDFLKNNPDKEFFEVNKDNNQVVYAKAIRLSQDCMSCHGDPATSPTGDGLDILGMRMENWKVGEMHGAFILSNDIETISASAWSAFWSGTTITLATAVPLLILISLAFYLYNKSYIIKPLSRFVDEISSTANEQSTMSSEISNAANDVADGTSSQAAAIEETSASLEMINSNTSQTADNSRQATTIAQKSRESVEACNERMQDLNEAMEAIQGSAKGISVIISTIDEIAFQTNLLALNAAVEAARAGEAGAGFAVVADEVRALANRSAKAAHETAKRIEESVTHSEQGVAIGVAFSESLNEILKQIRDIDSMVTDIAGSTSEQHQSLNQINQAVTQMDTITQQHAAAAEQTASAAATFAGKSRDLKQLSHQLSSFIGEHVVSDTPAGHSNRTAPKNVTPPSNHSTQAIRPITQHSDRETLTFEDFS